MPFGPIDHNAFMMFAASMNPLFTLSGMMHAMTPRVRPVYQREQIDRRAPIALKTRASDPGLKLVEGDNTLTISGKAKGDKPMRDVMGMVAGYQARGLWFSLDVDTAPTETLSGRTDYTEKNSRSFSWTTSLGQSAGTIAHGLAEKVNAHRSFKAAVEHHADGSATLRFSRR